MSDININGISESLNNKADLDLGNVVGIDYVVDWYPKTQEEKESAGANWWRLYKSGWCEQGGK